ncbi:MAG: hypothetical protein ACK578_19930, partial [Pirellula sp.]
LLNVGNLHPGFQLCITVLGIGGTLAAASEHDSQQHGEWEPPSLIHCLVSSVNDALVVLIRIKLGI